jgi:tetratricopeptide (TPR) repeat protein
MLAERPDDRVARASLASLYTSYGILLHDTGRTAAAEAALREGLGQTEELMARQPEQPGYRVGFCRTAVPLGRTLCARDRAREALDLFERAAGYLHGLRSSPDARRDQVGYQQARLRGVIGQAHRQLGHGPEATAVYRTAVEQARALHEGSPNDPEYRVLLADHCRRLADALRATDRGEEAERLLREAVALLEPVVAGHAECAIYQRTLSMALGELARLFLRTNRAAEAVACHERNIRLLEDLTRTHPSDFHYPHLLGGALNNLAVARNRTGD